eukprot:gene3752-5844_t
MNLNLGEKYRATDAARLTQREAQRVRQAVRGAGGYVCTDDVADLMKEVSSVSSPKDIGDALAALGFQAVPVLSEDQFLSVVQHLKQHHRSSASTDAEAETISAFATVSDTNDDT